MSYSPAHSVARRAKFFKYLVSKHVKPRKMGEAGGIVKAEGAMYASKVQVVCPHCNKPTRVGHQILTDGSKQRICKKCGEAL